MVSAKNTVETTTSMVMRDGTAAESSSPQENDPGDGGDKVAFQVFRPDVLLAYDGAECHDEQDKSRVQRTQTDCDGIVKRLFSGMEVPVNEAEGRS